jgi:Sulfotransferase family
LHPPRHPAAYIRLVNQIGEALARLHFAKPALCPDRLLKHAQRRTGLLDWGDESFVTGLERLTAALNRQARLSQIGRIAAYWNLLDHLCVRLRVHDYRTKRPEVAEQQIKQPLFILGLPRTGTTILHELIAQDRAFRSPASWEVTRPVPPPVSRTYQSDKRIVAVDRVLALLEQLTPGFRVIHAIGAELPQECVYILASNFISEQFGYLYNVPEYRDWILQHDMTASYAWHARFLQHLQVDYAREHWVLKAPAHLAYLKFLLAQYPDASIIWTHRRPLDAIASFSSLTYTLRRGFSSNVDPLSTGAYEFQHFSKVALRAIEDRQTLDTGQFIDVSFNAICTDPISVVSTVYERLNRELTRDTQALMHDYLRRRPRDLYGKHRYSADAYGLDADQEQKHYSEYLSHYAPYL